MFYSSDCHGNGFLIDSDATKVADAICEVVYRPRPSSCWQPSPTRYYGPPNILGYYEWQPIAYGYSDYPGYMVYRHKCTPYTSHPGYQNSGYLNNGFLRINRTARPKDVGRPAVCEPSTHVGNPIQIGTGIKFERFTIYEEPGPLGLTLEIFYSSKVRQSRTGSFGVAWHHSFERYVARDLNASTTLASVWREDGRALTFSKSGSSWLADSDVADQLIELVDGSGTTTGWQYCLANGDGLETYDAAGRLLSIASRAGVTTTLEYSDATTPPSIAPKPGLLIQVTSPVGRQLGLRYDAIARVNAFIDPAGGTTAFAYNASNDLTTVIFPDTKVRTFIYNELANLNLQSGFPPSGVSALHALTGILDENGVRHATFRYLHLWVDYGLVATYSSHEGANTMSLSFSTNPYNIANGGAYSTTVTDVLGRSRVFSFTQVLGRVHTTAISQPCDDCGPAAGATMGYDANGNCASRVDWNGNRTNRVYDLTRNLETSRTEALTSGGAPTAQTRTISTQWHATFRLPTAIAEPLRITTYTYDPDGTQCGPAGALCSKSIQATTDANGSQGFSATPTGSPRAWAYTYNANGSLLTENGPRTDMADVTTYTYFANNDADPNKRGNLASVTNAAGHTFSFTAYNALGQPTAMVDANGLAITHTYDLRRRLTARTVGSETTSYLYDGVGQVTKVTLPDGSFLQYTYDAAHRLTAIQDNLGNRIAYTLDGKGNRTQEQVFDPSSALAQTRSRVFSNLNRLFREIGATGQTTEYTYDNQGNATSVKDPLNQVTNMQYDALNRLKQVTAPGTVVTQFGYNGADALTSVTDPRGLVTGYSVDGLGNLQQLTSPDSGTTVSTYDPAGNVLTRTDAKGQVTTYAYDAINRVTLAAFHDGSRHAFAYDLGTNGLGRLSSITETDPSNQQVNLIAYAYDAYGRVTSESRTVNAVQYVTSYAYDPAGRLSGMTYPSGRTVSYSFDALGRVNQVNTAMGGSGSVVAQNVQYQPFGGVKSYTLGNGSVVGRTIDQDGRIASFTLGGGSVALGFDAASRITAIGANSYGYDNLDRLNSALLPTANYAYGYDGVGNRVSKTTGASTDSYSYISTSNRLSTLTPASGPVRNFSFDANGSTLADGLTTQVYDVRGRLTQATNSAGVTAYQVDALGQRVRKAGVLGDTVFHYDTQGKLIAETGPTGTLKRELIYLGDIPIGVVQ